MPWLPGQGVQAVPAMVKALDPAVKFQASC